MKHESVEWLNAHKQYQIKWRLVIDINTIWKPSQRTQNNFRLLFHPAETETTGEYLSVFTGQWNGSLVYERNSCLSQLSRIYLKIFSQWVTKIISSWFCYFFLQGFGATARSTQDCRRANPTDIVCFHQADVGEYLRSEDTLTWQNSENNKRTVTSQFGFFLAL